MSSERHAAPAPRPRARAASRERARTALRAPPLGRLLRSLRGLLGPGDTARQSLVALTLNSATSLVAGAFLGSITGTFEELPGLLVLVPAAIGLRGNVFSTFGNRLSTSIHTGTFELTLRRDSMLVQNVLASLVLTAAMSVVLAVVAKIVAVALGVPDTVSVLSLAMISVVGGMLASLIVLLASVGLAAGAVRYGWDLDNVVAPLVSTLGDVLTLPALWLAAFMVLISTLSHVLGIVVIVISLAAFVWALVSRAPVLRQVTRESWPVLVVAIVLSSLAGIVLQQRLGTFARYPALLVLMPAFVSSAGALGGILASRLSSKLHLGFMTPSWLPDPEARPDALSIMLLGAPVYLFNAVGAHLVATALGQASPGLLPMIGASMIGGFFAVAFVVAIAYYGTIAAVGLRVDPDTYGIPIVTSSVDFVGAVALITAAVALHIT